MQAKEMKLISWTKYIVFMNCLFYCNTVNHILGMINANISGSRQMVDRI